MLTNRFKHVLNRYDNPTLKEEEYTNLELDFAVKSIKLDRYKFTNFVKSEQNEQYKLIKEIYIDYKKGKNILDRFKAYDVELHYKNTQRLLDILSYNNMQKFTKMRVSNILKYHMVDNNNKLRIYIERDINGCLIVRLIDLFHLAIPSAHKGIPAEIMKERIYNQHKNNKISINLIKNKFKIVEP